MDQYMRLARKGLIICSSISLVSFVLCYATDGIEYGKMRKTLIIYSCFSLSGAYIASIQAILYDIFAGRGDWNSRRKRYLGASIVGASLALFGLAWKVIFSEDD